MSKETNKEFTKELIDLLENVKKQYGYNAIVTIRADDFGVIVRDVVSRKILYDADTLVEFTSKFLGNKE